MLGPRTSGHKGASGSVDKTLERKLSYTRNVLDYNRVKRININSEKRRSQLKAAHKKNMLLHAMENENFELPEDLKKDKKETVSKMEINRLAMKEFVHNSKNGFLLDLAQIIVSFVSTLTYVVECYLLESVIYLPTSIRYIEIIVSFFFIFDYLLHWYISESRIQYIFGMDALFDMASIIPILGYANPAQYQYLIFLRVFRVARVYRVLRLVVKTTMSDDSEVTHTKVRQQLYRIFFLFYMCMFIGAGLIHAYENFLSPGSFVVPWRNDECEVEYTDLYTFVQSYDGAMFPQATLYNEWHPKKMGWKSICHFTYWDAAYLLLITITTIGYGDVHPKTVWAQLLTLGVVLSLTISLPPEFNLYTDMSSRASKYSGSYNNPSNNPHVLVCGDIDTRAAMRFLKEFFHEDHGDVKDIIVFLCHYEPDEMLATALADSYYESRVEYLKGSVLVESDLKRSAFMDCKAVFVLSNQYSVDPTASDACSVLAIKAMKDIRPTKLPVYVQLLSTESKNHGGWAKWNHLVCLEEFEAAVLARNVVCPGFSTLITNLMKSSAEWEIGDKEVSAWMREYLYGFGQEIYCVAFSSYFTNVQFEKASCELFREFGVCLFAISAVEDRVVRRKAGKQKKKDKEVKRITLVNPLGYYIRSGDMAFLVADDYEDAEIVNFWDGSKEMEPDPELLSKNLPRQVGNNVVELSPAKVIKRPLNKSEISLRMKKKQNAVAKSPLRKVSISNLSDLNAKDGASLNDSIMASTKLQLETKTVEIETKDATKKEAMTKTMGKASPKLSKQQKDAWIYPMHVMHKAPADLAGHCILVGSMKGIKGFLSVLRFFSHIPVLLLNEFDDHEAVIQSCVDEYKNIYILQGNGLSTQFLLDAGVERAHCVVVRSDPTQAATKNMGTRIRDTATIFTSCIIEEEFNCRIIAEMLDEQSMAFLKHRPSSDDPSCAWPQYCSGQVYLCDIDSVVCQIYYNESVMALLTRLIFSTELNNILHPEKERPLHHYRECDALIQIKVPRIFDKQEYHVLYTYLVMKLRILPLGVYRSPFTHTAPLPYIVTNPKPEMILSRHDRVFVLCDPRSCTNENTVYKY